MERFTFQQAMHSAGGFARIVRGTDNVLEREIAVKVLDRLLGEGFSESDRERSRREARILAKLSHPNIPAIYDVDFREGHLWIIFQFIEGKNLRETLNDSGPIPIATAKTWFQQVASALDHAHRLGIIHRDVKPENIIITPDQQSAYLVDFGIALSAEQGRRITTTGYVIGTPGYMSPEQQAGEAVDGSSDVYSLAVTLYEVLSGRPVRQALYEALSTINEAIPPQIDDLILACLEDKATRLDSAKLFSSQLAGALQLPSKPFSEVLSHGRLHELAISLESLTPSDVVRLPMGQRDLLTSKINDLVTSNEPSLEYPSERFLELMLTRGVFLPKEDYQDIVAPSVEWAFERIFDHRLGKRTIRDALEQAAFTARADAHQVLVEEFTKFLNRLNLNDKEDWYLHAIREVIVALMANPVCTEGSGVLKRALRTVNKLQRSRTEVGS